MHSQAYAGVALREFDGFHSDKAVYIHTFAGHCYVVGHDPDFGSFHIADGSNFYMTNADIRASIDDDLGVSGLIPHRYIHQTGVDHCASSAVLIALEFMKHLKTKIWPDLISPS